jgi:GMP synthase (glutamine-hydrolysing)|tara:strand:+ start:165 stop:1700 length:1536 start_codon:yes stop_codon:yes gene_type:complete
MTVAVIDFGAKYTHNPVAVVDFGSQYTQLIARRVRELNVYSKLFPSSVKADELKNTKAIILSGSRSGVYETDAPKLDPDILNLGIPILGICYGLQEIVRLEGGRIIRGTGEYGLANIYDEMADKWLLYDITGSQVWMSHGDEIQTLPKTFDVLARSSNNVIAAIKHKEKPIYGVQFHPEVAHSLIGKDIFRNFLFYIAKLQKDWTPEYIIIDTFNAIREQVGNGEVITAISGGVDSAVVGTLLHKAIGDQSKCVFIDTGLLRKNEANEIMESMQELGLNITKYDFTQRFWKALENITDPEVKRKAIGREFIRCFEDVTKDAKFLAQGTLYPDVIESGKDIAATIKSHHNVGGLPDDMEFTLIEPLRNLFKDEVRLLGKELKMPDHILNRQPFPGPGLAVRILGEVTHERLRILREADSIFLKTLGDIEGIWQAFAVLIPNKTVGVMGDDRTYENIIALRAVSSEDGMTADWVRIPPDLLEECSSNIIRGVPGVNRVVYDITSKPPGTIEWE